MTNKHFASLNICAWAKIPIVENYNFLHFDHDAKINTSKKQPAIWYYFITEQWEDSSDTDTLHG